MSIATTRLRMAAKETKELKEARERKERMAWEEARKADALVSVALLPESCGKEAMRHLILSGCSLRQAYVGLAQTKEEWVLDLMKELGVGIYRKKGEEMGDFLTLTVNKNPALTKALLKDCQAKDLVKCGALQSAFRETGGNLGWVEPGYLTKLIKKAGKEALTDDVAKECLSSFVEKYRYEMQHIRADTREMDRFDEINSLLIKLMSGKDLSKPHATSKKDRREFDLRRILGEGLSNYDEMDLQHGDNPARLLLALRAHMTGRVSSAKEKGKRIDFIPLPLDLEPFGGLVEIVRAANVKDPLGRDVIGWALSDQPNDTYLQINLLDLIKESGLKMNKEDAADVLTVFVRYGGQRTQPEVFKRLVNLMDDSRLTETGSAKVLRASLLGSFQDEINMKANPENVPWPDYKLNDFILPLKSLLAPEMERALEETLAKCKEISYREKGAYRYKDELTALINGLILKAESIETVPSSMGMKKKRL